MVQWEGTESESVSFSRDSTNGLKLIKINKKFYSKLKITLLNNTRLGRSDLTKVNVSKNCILLDERTNMSNTLY